MTTNQQTKSQAYTELPVRLYSALRTIRIYPPSNPQVTKTTNKVISLLNKLLEQEGKEITLASSGRKILVNGNPLPEKDQQRPQVQGLIEFLDTLQIHALTFQNDFTASDCIHFLELLSAAGSNIQPDQPIKALLQEAGLDSVSIDEKRYVAVHEGEQVVTEDQIGPGGGLRIENGDLAGFILGKTSGDSARLSTAALRQLLASDSNATGDSSRRGMEGQDALKALIDGIGHTTSPDEKARLLAHSSTALAGLAPDLLTRLLATLPQDSAADVLLAGTVKQMDPNQLEALLLALPEVSLSGDIEQIDGPQQGKDIFPKLLKTDRAGEIEQTAIRIKTARTLVELSANPTPQHLKEQLQQPQWSAPVLVTALRQLAGRQLQDSTHEAFFNLLARYERDLAPTIRDQVASQAACRLATLQEHELGRVLVQRYKGIFGEELYSQVITQLSDEQFERIAQRLNLLSRNKQASASALDAAPLLAGYQRLMDTVRGEKLRAALSMHQEEQDKVQQLNQDQIRKNIKLLLSGEHTVLGDEQIVQTLPSSVKRLLKHDKSEAADKLLIQMVTGLQKNDPAIRRGSAEALGRTAAALVQAGEWQRLDRLLPALGQALPFMEDLQAGSQALQAVEQLTRHHLTHKAYNRAINALNVLFDLTIHTPAGNSALYDLTLACLVRLAEPALLGELLKNILAGNKESDNCWYLLSRMGAGAANFLMERLGTSESREERELLLRLIGDIGKPARDALLFLLQQDSPWYVTRNIIRLLKNVGDADCFTVIAPFLHHEDVRVQQEVIQTLGVIGGTARKNFFLHELERTADDLKPLIVRQLGKIHNESIVLPLTDLLESSAGPPHQEKEQLQIEICVALVRLGSKKALTSLKKIIQTKKIPGITDYSPKVLAAAESAVQAISADSKVLSDTGQQTEPVSQSYLTRKNDPLAEQEASIFRKAGRGKTEEAKKELYELIISYAEKKDFANAERLRERIYEIDPMALSEIIRSGEIIEREKTGAVSRDQLATWSRLLKKLNNVEFSAIYHELQERRFAPEEIIVRQGDKNDELYFINQGSIKISYNQDGREIFVSTMNNGQIIGENFFDASFWTVTLTALTPVNISVLKWDSFRRWQEEYPGLEAKLQDFYKQCDTTRVLLEKKGLDRRKYERTRLSRKIQLQLTDHNNKPIGRGFRGELTDISEGGLAFLIRISKKENTRLLLGRNMQITIPVGGDPGHLQLHGLAIGIQSYEPLECDFSVHIKFPELLDQETLFQVLG
ncbi:MAG TPA: cyclic nucleotide-binding domain-containing protein [Desulfobulbus sp.]|nr:cyclic nucleotide-binding domain-containing protein [Desulfobulbus sp.]